jgi:hypothetical protein
MLWDDVNSKKQEILTSDILSFRAIASLFFNQFIVPIDLFTLDRNRTDCMVDACIAVNLYAGNGCIATRASFRKGIGNGIKAFRTDTRF